jgi:hypothetical protein
VAPEERVVVLARRLLPAAIALVFAGAFYAAGFFFDAVLIFPLLLVAPIAIAVETVCSYRSDVGQRMAVLHLEREQQIRDRLATTRYDNAMDEIGTLAVGARAVATVPTLLSTQLSVLTPLLDEVLTRRSVGRRRLLLGQMEAAAVEAVVEIAGAIRASSGRAVLYRRVDRRFEPAWVKGRWDHEPPAARRSSELASELRTVLRDGLTTSRTAAGWARCTAPVYAGRRYFGVILVERSTRFTTEELDAVAVMAGMLTAAASAVPPTPRRRAAAQAPARRRPPRVRPLDMPVAPDVALARGGERVRATLGSQLSALIAKADPQAIAAVRRALSG